MPLAIRKLANVRPDRSLRATNDLLSHRVNAVQAELLHHLQQRAAARIVAGRLGVKVTHHLIRLPHVCAHDLQ